MIEENEADARRQRLADDLVDGHAGFLLARANVASLAATTAALRAHGLKTRSYSVLALACHESPPSQKEVADVLRLDPSQVVVVVDDLQGRGLVERLPDSRDGRSKVLVATSRGRDVYAHARHDVSRAENAFFTILTDAQRARLNQLLRPLAFPANDPTPIEKDQQP